MSVMLNNSKRYLAYICPFCSEITNKEINIFDFSSSSPIQLLCGDSDCLEECVLISRNKDKFKIVIECAACGDVHTFNISSSGFLLKELLTFSCPETNINIFFAGEKSKVEASVEENKINFSNLSKQFDMLTEELNVVYRIADKLYYLINENKIHCSCGSNNILPDMSDGGIVLMCTDCKNHIIINPDEENLIKLENSDGFTI